MAFAGTGISRGRFTPFFWDKGRRLKMVKRVFIEKKSSVSKSAENFRKELNDQLSETISKLRIFIRYDMEGIEEKAFMEAVNIVFSEAPVDNVYHEKLPKMKDHEIFSVEYLPGQYDLRADSASQCIQILTMGNKPIVRCASVYAFSGAKDVKKIKNHLINPVESRPASEEKPESLKEVFIPVGKVKTLNGFRTLDKKQLHQFHDQMSLAMNIDDLEFIRRYFIGEERDPTETEILVLDTYWSDHCRHSTFLTELSEISFNSEIDGIEECYMEYLTLFRKHYSANSEKYKCLMDMATMGLRELKSRGLLKNYDESEEINACSIKVMADTSGGPVDYYVMFKNETHNHPTEIEPFGGAATCLGGAIRDPLSGRAYVYHAMRISGASDLILDQSNLKSNFKSGLKEEYSSFKLPQRFISREAARGFSSYGNQIGLATGIVEEIYHPSYAAKRLEAGFVIGAAPVNNVVRKEPENGDIVLLLGGETGRDGCGGATGSSRSHRADSVLTGEAEVQKGNPVTERKIQRLFRNPECTTLIKRCNDFGAGGVCVAIGELAGSLLIDLNAIPKKYEGLNATELAISESQERMALVISPDDLDKMLSLCASENLNAVPVAKVTDSGRLIMTHDGEEVLNIKADFLSTNGVRQKARAEIRDVLPVYMDRASESSGNYLKEGNYIKAFLAELGRLNIASNKGMKEMFDSTIGAGSIFLPLGGKRQLTPALVMAAKLPVYPMDTDTVTVSAWGFDPFLMSESPFVGAQYSVLLSVAKLCAAGVSYENIYLSFQEYFKKLGTDPLRWGEPVSAILGALKAQLGLELAAIGGKDSMSGTFMDMDVVPTLISFSIAPSSSTGLISNVLYEGAHVYRVSLKRDKSRCPDYDYFKKLMKILHYLISEREIDFCAVVESGGAAMAIAKSCFGNGIGFSFDYCREDLFFPLLGDILIAGNIIKNIDQLKDFSPEFIGRAGGSFFKFKKESLNIDEAEKVYLKTMSSIFPLNTEGSKKINKKDHNKITWDFYKGEKISSPHVLIPVFPGTNCEYDTAKKFMDAGAKTEFFIFKNLKPKDILDSCIELAALINKSQIIAIPGGFSGGDEPDGSAKFISAVFRSPSVAEAMTAHIEVKQGLVLGICNGFQALVKLGLLPFGKITPMTENSPTLFYNNIGRHVSSICPVRVCSVDSPWLSNVRTGDIFLTPVSHGEGRFIADDALLEELLNTGRICTQYADDEGNPTGLMPHNPNGSMYAIEGLISPCGRILGKMGHVERTGDGLYINMSEIKSMDIFSAGVNYFK